MNEEKRQQLEARIEALEAEIEFLLTPVGNSVWGVSDAIPLEEELRRIKEWLDTGGEPPTLLEIQLLEQEEREEKYRQIMYGEDGIFPLPLREILIGGLLAAASIYYAKG